MGAIQSLLLTSALLAGAAARAQDVGGVLDLNGIGIYGMEDAVMEAARGPSKKAPAPKAAPVRLTYIPSMARRKQNYAAFVAKTRTKDPKAADDLQKLFSSTDVIALAGQKMAPLGLRTDNVADAYALWWVASYSAANGKEIPMDRSVLAAVKAQTAKVFGSVKGTAKLTDTTRQQVAEACVLHAVLIDSAMERAKGKPDELKAVATAVRQGALATGIDLDALKLTPKGFVAK